MGPILAMLISIVPSVLITWFAAKMGYQGGHEYLSKLQGGDLMEKLMYVCGIVGLMSVGGMIATLIGATTPLQFAEGTVVIQDILDGMMPQMISLGLTGLMYWLIKKNVNTGWLLVIAIVGGIAPLRGRHSGLVATKRLTAFPRGLPGIPYPRQASIPKMRQWDSPLSHPQRTGDSVQTTVTLRAPGNVAPQKSKGMCQMYEIDLNLPKQIVADVLSNHEIHSVAFVGCGASMSDLYPAKYFLANNTDKLNVQIFTANEFNYDTPSWVNEHTFVITCSLGGSTPETVEANKTAKKHNCPVVSLTNKAGSALTVDADYVIVHGFHANFAAKCEKPGYAIALALEILQQTEGYDKYDDMITGLTNVFDLCENAAQSCKKLAKKFAEDFKDDKMIYFMASGASEKMAYSHAAFLFTEMQWIDAAAYNTGEYFHGPFEVSTEGKPYVFFMSDGATRPMDARALTFL